MGLMDLDLLNKFATNADQLVVQQQNRINARHR